MPDVTLSSLERALKCAEFALDKKGIDVKILEIAKISSIEIGRASCRERVYRAV
jgi:hypothetical protein